MEFLHNLGQKQSMTGNLEHTATTCWLKAATACDRGKKILLTETQNAAQLASDNPKKIHKL